MTLAHPIIAVVTHETRLAGLKARWATSKAAAFRLHHAAEHELEYRLRRLGRIGQPGGYDVCELERAARELADSQTYEEEDRNYQTALNRLLAEIDLGHPLRTVDRALVPTFDFGRCLAVIVIGQDGLVANAAKYVGDLPIIGVNPDPARYDGVLLPFQIHDARSALRRTIDGRVRTRDVTLAEVNTNDGQRMLAFNDFFVGCHTHVSARYVLESDAGREPQTSSGVLVATGAGSTGWLSSLFNMTEGFSRFFGGPEIPRVRVGWEERRLVWAVREPFRSRQSGADLVAGVLEEGRELIVGSQMPTSGVIFSDGVESDFIEFNSGTIARFTVSPQRAKLVIPATAR
jgi:NAD kinase